MSCQLSPSASAFSTMLSAFIGSLLNGLFSGFWVAFITGWISWLAFIRILAAGAYELHLTVEAGTNFAALNDDQYQSIGMNEFHDAGSHTTGAPTGHQSTVVDEEARLNQSTDPVQGHVVANYPAGVMPGLQPKKLAKRRFGGAFKEPERTVTVFGWLGWVWSALYTPLSQSIWLAVNFTSSQGAVQLVRALAIAVSALGLTFDYKQRYAAALGRKWGAWAFVTFNIWNAAACLLLGVEATILLIHGMMNIHFGGMAPIPLFVIYPLFSIFWAWASWRIVPPTDGARPGINIYADVLMGAFAGLFVAAPAFALWQNQMFDESVVKSDVDGSGASFFGIDSAKVESELGLGEFLSCSSASVLEKFAAIMP